MDNELTIGDLAELIGAPVNTLKTLRHRGQWVAWDGAADDLHENTSWRRYSVVDAALTGALIELIDAGVSAKAAATIINSSRGAAASDKHPLRPSASDDIWVGLLRLDEGAADVGGRMPELLKDVIRHVGSDIEHFDGGGSLLLIVNVSRHFRRIRAALNEGA